MRSISESGTGIALDSSRAAQQVKPLSVRGGGVGELENSQYSLGCRAQHGPIRQRQRKIGQNGEQPEGPPSLKSPKAQNKPELRSPNAPPTKELKFFHEL